MKLIFAVILSVLAFDSYAIFRYVPPKPPSLGYKTKTIGLPGGEKLELVWQGATKTQGFWIGKYEVTRTQWLGVMGANPFPFTSPGLAVEYVSWQDCQEFCHKVGKGLRLPTEAEWMSAQVEAERFADRRRFDPDNTHLVFHACDNVWEWCEEGICRKDCDSRCINSKLSRSAGLGFRVCCSPSLLDKMGNAKVGHVVVTIISCLLYYSVLILVSYLVLFLLSPLFGKSRRR